MRSVRLTGLSMLVALWACTSDNAPERTELAAELGPGPNVVFDMAAPELPEIPLPNDVATFADPSSRTGRRINVSTLAATQMETAERLGMTGLEGWGTLAPITVRFSPMRTGEAALDLSDFYARMTNGEVDFSDDALYVIDLETGDPVPLDLGTRGQNYIVARRDLYGPNDPHASEANLLFDTHEEGAGLGQADYRPELDTDQDGVLDHPNVFGPSDPKGLGIGDLLSWYERETDTLILRPVVPMRPKTKYAVVLSHRMHAAGQADAWVRSPFAWKLHPSQAEDGQLIDRALKQGARREVYGDLAEQGLAGVSFAWTFTTQPIADDVVALRDGLYGQGPFARLASEFPADLRLLRTVGLSPDDNQPSGWEQNEACKSRVGQPYLVRVSQSKNFIHQLIETILGFGGTEGAALEESLTNIDYFALGEFEAPLLVGTPNQESPRDVMQFNASTGEARYVRNKISMWISVPKRKAGDTKPFPLAVWSHGSSLHNDEMLIRAGHFAAQGMATVAINLPGHGLSVDPRNTDLAKVFLRQDCLAPWFTAASQTRATDIDHDGTPDSGALLWSTHMAHTRANVLQSVLDQMNLTRMLRAFDGTRRGVQDLNLDGTPDLLGDLDGDGLVDIGGQAPMTAAGNSFGGIVAMLQGALDPNIEASAPISGGGGMADVALRSDFVVDSVILKAISPAIVGIPARKLTLKPGASDDNTRCKTGQVSVRYRVADLLNGRELEIACVPESTFAGGTTLALYNKTLGRKSCARGASDGSFRIAVPANIDDRLELELYEGADQVDSYATCALKADARKLRTFDTWEVETGTYKATKDGDECTADGGCQQFDGRLFPVGSPLVAPQEGLGLARQTPRLRRLMGFSQAMLDSVDPANYMHYYTTPALDPWGRAMKPRGLAAFAVTGDPTVPNSATYVAARAAGALPFVDARTAQLVPSLRPYAAPDSLRAPYMMTPNAALHARHAFEGLAWVGRTRGGPSCKPNRKAGCSPSGDATLCQRALDDADWMSEGLDTWDAPHPNPPLRLVREARVADSIGELESVWLPRAQGGLAGAGYSNPNQLPLLALVHAYIEPQGRHVWINPDPCNTFDETGYHTRLLARFLATQGRDLYSATHPATHRCLADASCDFFAAP